MECFYGYYNHLCKNNTEKYVTGKGSYLYCGVHAREFGENACFDRHPITTRLRRRDQIKELVYIPEVLINIIIDYESSFLGTVEGWLSGPIKDMSCLTCLSNGKIACASNMCFNSNKYMKFGWDPIVTIIDSEENYKKGIYQIISTRHTKDITCITSLKNSIITGSEDKTIRIYNIKTGERRVLTGHTKRIQCVTIIKEYIVSGSEDKTIRIWDPNTGICKHVLKGHDNAITCLGILSTGKIISGSVDGKIRLWDLSKDTFEINDSKVIFQNIEPIGLIAVLPDDTYVIAFKEWCIIKGIVPKSDLIIKNNIGSDIILKGHRDYVSSLVVLSDGRIASSSKDGTIRIWNMETGSCDLTLSDRYATKSGLAGMVSTTNNRLITGSENSVLTVWQ